MTNNIQKKLLLQRITAWSLVAAYTLALPYANTAYNSFVRHFSSDLVEKIPIILVILMGIAYVVWVLILKKGIKALALLIPCAIIIIALFSLEPKTNKHIHIPEYILMAWLLFEAISIDYQGQGVFILLFICAFLLGIVDELEQGIHPQRFFGWRDMVMNSAGSIVGILTIFGLRRLSPGDWSWIVCFRRFKLFIGIAFLGLFGAVLSCGYLFKVQQTQNFWSVFPKWLLIGNGLFVAAGLLVIVFFKLFYTPVCSTDIAADNSPAYARTACLWILCPLTILTCLHGLVLFVVLTGIPFR